MTRIRFIPAQVKTFPDERPDACKRCGSPILTRHGTAEKSVTDLYVDKVTVVRYRCSDCERTFRHCPEGIDRGGQTRRMRGWAALAWALGRVDIRLKRTIIAPLPPIFSPSFPRKRESRGSGDDICASHPPRFRTCIASNALCQHALGLSLRSASHLLAAFGVSVSRMSVWRDVQETGRNARRKQAGRARGRVTVIGADETVVRVKGETTFVGVVTDASTGEVLGLEALVKRDSDGFMEWLGDFARGCGVETMAADDLNACKPAVERLGLDHQICTARVRKRARKRLDGIEGWDWVKARIWRRLTDLPPSGGLELLRLERAVRDGDAALRRLCVELSGKWRALLCHRRRRDVPRTNNAAERAIGRSKIRCKTVGGYKSEDWMLNGFGLTQRAWSGRDGLDMSDLVAAQRRALR